MKLLMFLFIVLTISQDNEKYEYVLDGLNLSYVKYYSEKEANTFFKLFKVTEEQFIEDKCIYEKSVEDFYNLDIGIIDYLLRFKKNNELCNWVTTHHPESSKLETTILKSTSALILIDNYLTPNNKEINNTSVKKLTYFKIKRFLKRNKGEDIKVLKTKYHRKFHKEDCGGNGTD